MAGRRKRGAAEDWGIVYVRGRRRPVSEMSAEAGGRTGADQAVPIPEQFSACCSPKRPPLTHSNPPAPCRNQRPL